MASEDTPRTELQPTGIKNTKKNAASYDLTKKKIKMLELSAKEGVKRGNEMAVANKLQESTNVIQKRRANNNAKKIKMDRERMEMDIMEKDVFNMDNMAKEYFLMKKRKILHNYQEQENKAFKKKKEKDLSHQSSKPDLYHHLDYQSSKQDPLNRDLPDLSNFDLHSELQASALHYDSQRSALHSESQGSVPESTDVIQKRQANSNAKKIKMDRERMEMDIMEKDVFNMDNMAKEYFLMKKRKILHNYQEQENKAFKKKKEKDLSHQSSKPDLYHHLDYQSSKQDPLNQDLPDLSNFALHSELQASALPSALHYDSQRSALHSESQGSVPDEESFVGRVVDPSLTNL
ncbi:hypothetical protein PCASD_01811 [Puccinia coronata f. sp. avenae]|uniref:No apical meristem-associated C-terminal domain-containing protein n=1 Tax=Puccinia coronata f. sp. avenae TaxID=200324 RepID=A0A2N5TDQ8_9BASI|nr:hypothetical protein PCASD_12396 [Puccinia coronata f. sp. avenae]PLW50084.1 hypothetical protein PCASD_01811 [Puccinia coronata f. sp. avenae]